MKKEVEEGKGKGSKRRRGRRSRDVISWACEHEHEQVSMKGIGPNLFKNILPT